MTLEVLGLKTPVVYKDLTNTNLRGYFDAKENKIFICQKSSEKEQIQTLIHELAHAALIRIHLGNVINPDVHETIVDVIATSITENFELKWKKRK